MNTPLKPTDPDAELDLLREVQTRGQERKLAALLRLRNALDLPIDEHLASIADALAGKTEAP